MGGTEIALLLLAGYLVTACGAAFGIYGWFSDRTEDGRDLRRQVEAEGASAITFAVVAGLVWPFTLFLLVREIRVQGR